MVSKVLSAIGWQGRLTLVVGAAVLVALAVPVLTVWQSVVLGLGWLLGAVLLLRRDLGWVFGPVFFYDLVRTSRSGRPMVFRCMFGAVLLVVLYLFFEASRFTKEWELFGTIQMPRDEVPKFAERFFHAFLVVQFVVVLVVTPGYTAGAVAEEKETRTLEYLLATDLHSREIVLGKLFSRLGNMVLLVLAGLPILSLTLFFGGVDPFGLLVGYGGTLLVLLSGGSLSILVSVQSKRTLNAVLSSYMWMGLFLACCPFMPPMSLAHPASLWPVITRTQDRLFLPSMPWEVTLVWFAASHLLLAAFFMYLAVSGLRPAALRYRAWAGGLPPPPKPAIPLPRRPAAEPVVLTLADDGLAYRPVEPAKSVGPEPTERPLRPISHLALRPPSHRPPVGESAMRWKEFHAEPVFGPSDLGAFVQGMNLIFCILLVTVVILALLVLAEQNLWGPAQARWDEFARQGNYLVRPVGTLLASLMLLGIGITASMTVSRERERQTLDSLLTTPLEIREILWAKLLGSLWRMRALGWALLVVWGLGFLSGAVHMLSLALLLLAFTVFAGFFASLGMWFSTICPTTARATLMTILAGLVFLGGPWVMSGQFTEVYRSLGMSSEWIQVLNDVQESGLSPPAALVVLAYPIAESHWPSHVPAALVGVAFYALFGWGLWLAVVARFRRTSGRSEMSWARSERETAKR